MDEQEMQDIIDYSEKLSNYIATLLGRDSEDCEDRENG
jgi:hypothetical protein